MADPAFKPKSVWLHVYDHYVYCFPNQHISYWAFFEETGSQNFYKIFCYLSRKMSFMYNTRNSEMALNVQKKEVVVDNIPALTK